jgi:hypothetical protein
MQQVTRFQGKFACDLDHRHTAVDGVNIHHANGSREGCHLVHKLFVGSRDHDGGMVEASAIGADDKTADLALRHAINLFQDRLHCGHGRGAHNEGDGLAIRPAIGLRFANLDQLSERDGTDRIGFVGNQGKIPRRRQGGADKHEYRDTQKASVEHSSSPQGPKAQSYCA